MIKTKLLYIILIISLPAALLGQTGAPSAYTNFGIGSINNSGLVKNQGMGGTGMAIQTDNFINALNPASLTGIDSLNMLIDMGLRVNFTNYKTNEGNGDAISGGLHNISLAFRSAKNLYTSFGLSQVSSVGYNVATTSTIEGSMDIIGKEYKGTGGVNEVYLSNAVGIGKNFALGLKLSYLFGGIEKTEVFSSSVIGGALSVEYTDYVQQFKFEPGFQYRVNVFDQEISVGATYSPEVDFATNRSVTTSSSSGAGINEDIDDGTDYKIPVNMAGGVAWANKRGLKIAADYRFQEWSSVSYKSRAADLKDSHRFSMGAEFRNRETKRANPFLYQLGGYVEDSYIKVEGNSIIDTGISAGIGIPMRNSRSYFNINLNYGRRGPRGGDLIKENYFGINLSLSMVEFWFMKRQFD